MNIVYTIWHLIELWMAIYLLIPFMLLIVYLFKKWKRAPYDVSKQPDIHDKNFDFAAVITAHKSSLLVPALVDSLLKQQYECFTIYVVADGCVVDASQFNDPRVIICKPSFPLNAKIKSIDFAIRNFIREHDALIIFDSDNLVHPKFLSVVNQYFRKGFRAVQGNLQPKNSDSRFAQMDAMGDLFHNFTEREARMELGFSSAIWGSGIAIETALYRGIVYGHEFGGFDKRMQADLVRQIPQLAFAREAILYDEKISNGASLKLQRTRWIYAYFKHVGLGWEVFREGLKRKNANLIFFGFANIRPPFFLLCLFGCFVCVLNYTTIPALFYVWLIVLGLFALSFLLIVFIKSRDKKMILNVFLLPVFIIYQLAALFNIRKAGKAFLKTEHHKLVHIEDLLRQ